MKITKKVSKPISLTAFLNHGMRHYDHHRGVDKIHATDLTSFDEQFCPREFALLHYFGKHKKGLLVHAALRHTFDMGEDIAWRICNEYLRHEAVGHWRCLSCDQFRYFRKRPTSGCDRADIRCRWQYEEVRVDLFPITAGIDLFVDVGKPKLKLVEIKTMIKEEFKKLAAPLSEHRVRTNLYLKVVAESGYADDVDTSEGIVLYVAKSYGAMSAEAGTITPFKEYRVERNDGELVPYLQQAEAYKRYLEDKLWPKGICNTSMCKRAKKCGVVKECFSGKYKVNAKVT